MFDSDRLVRVVSLNLLLVNTTLTEAIEQLKVKQLRRTTQSRLM